MHSRTVPSCCYSLFVNRKRIKDAALQSLIAVVLVMIFVSLLAQRLFHPR
jgi:hypothetical protein